MAEPGKFASGRVTAETHYAKGRRADESLESGGATGAGERGYARGGAAATLPTSRAETPRVLRQRICSV